MSYIIDYLTHLQSPTPKISHRDLFLHDQKVNILKLLPRITQTAVVTASGQDEVAVQALIKQVFRELSGIMKIRLRPDGETIVMLKLLNSGDSPFLVGGRTRRLMLCRAVEYFHTAYGQQDIKLSVCMTKGEVQAQSAGLFFGDISPAHMEQMLINTLRAFSKILTVLYEPLNFVKGVSRQSAASFQLDTARMQANEKVNRLFYYSQFMNVFINLSMEATNDELSIINRQKKEGEAITSLKKNFTPAQFERNGMSLYNIFEHGRPELEVSWFQITPLQREEISKLTAPPTVPRGNQMEVPYVVNHIKLIKKMEDSAMKRIAGGGFSNIFLAEMEYRYVGSYARPGQPSEVMKGIPPQKRSIAIKRDLLPEPAKSRVAHQKKVLQYVKSGICMLLPKYYIVNDPESPLFNDLLMDYINAPNLYEYTAQCRETLSFQNKLYLGFIIAQALRYLQEYQIVHLDLKPANIMLSRRMTVKLIDFGEAYHPEVKGTSSFVAGHHPGFTMPYSAPENYNMPTTYTHKNDVFSLGVILHEFFFGRFPFYIANEKNRNIVYRRGTINNHWFCTPEENVDLGDPTVMSIVQLMIGKCLSPNPNERPELEWVVLTIRHCLDLL